MHAAALKSSCLASPKDELEHEQLPLKSGQEIPAETPMCGKVTAIRGTVVDAWFKDGLPPIDAALQCELDSDKRCHRGGAFSSGHSSVRQSQPTVLAACDEVRQ